MLAASAAASMSQAPAYGASVYLNQDNITVALGASHAAQVAANPTFGPFWDVSIANALRNVIDAPSATSPEDHFAGGGGTHVWVNGGHLELDFDFGAEYDLTMLHFWNYFTEFYDVDDIAFTFFDSGRNVVGTLNASPRLGNDNGGGPIIPEHYELNFPTNVQFVNAWLTGSNGQVDFNNIGFTAILSPPAVPEPAAWAMLIAGFGLVGSAMRRTRLAAPAM